MDETFTLSKNKNEAIAQKMFSKHLSLYPDLSELKRNDITPEIITFYNNTGSPVRKKYEDSLILLSGRTPFTSESLKKGVDSKRDFSYDVYSLVECLKRNKKQIFIYFLKIIVGSFLGCLVEMILHYFGLF